MTVHARQMTFDDLANAEYREFVEKFKPKKTTDDCYTPDNIYAVVRDWACARYGIDPASIVRPFWPGGDYERFDYPAGCFVLDNPPFSILSRIVRFYMAHKIRFFLFAPALTTFVVPESGANYVSVGCTITYENGAEVCTSFVTSEGEWLVETAPDLYRAVREVNKANRKQKTRKTRKYVMPDCVATAARLQWMAQHGTEYRIARRDAVFIRDLDCGCNLFGGAFLLSERAAAERAAAERVVLSDRERALQKSIGPKPEKQQEEPNADE